MHITVVGAGHVGAVCAACFAELGHVVDCVESNPERLGRLRVGQSPLLEAGLAGLLSRWVGAGTLRFHSAFPTALPRTLAFIAVGTDAGRSRPHIAASVERAAQEALTAMPAGSVLVLKSTSPVGTADRVSKLAGAYGVSVVVNPEFLREGSAVRDFMQPDRIVIGADDRSAADEVEAAYAGLHARVQRVSIRSAELIKYASNAFLATKISYINLVANICESVGADVEEVAAGMGSDTRIGTSFLSAGLGWGGSCLPKDVSELIALAEESGVDAGILTSAINVNSARIGQTINKLRSAGVDLRASRIAILGATFKPDTDDLRGSPALNLAAALATHGADVAVFDPSWPAVISDGDVRFAPTIIDAVTGAHAIVVATEWPEFRQLDWSMVGGLVAQRIVIDARNCLDADVLSQAGFLYRCVGRPGRQS